MTILAPGTFRVRDYRKPIPAAVEKTVRKRYELDHDPALTNRPYDTKAGDFIPPQHDPDFIFLREAASHDEKTFGRKAGAAKTVTTRGSDVGERARTKDIRESQTEHHRRMQAKLTGAPAPRTERPKMQGRPFSKQSRGFERRRP